MPDLRDRTLSRRGLFGWLGGLGLAAFIPGCGESDNRAGETAAATTGTGTGATPSCVLMPELTEGPYYLDLDLVRRDLAEGRPGAPLDLDVTVVDADSCEPIPDAAVDVWHCDATGVYSGVDGNTETFCRGVQLTGANGSVRFETVYPGWYPGRAVHVHLKVVLGGGEHTGQLFFDDAFTDSVYAAEPYAGRGTPDVANASDGIFAQSEGSTIVSVRAAGEGLAGTVTLGVRRA